MEWKCLVVLPAADVRNLTNPLNQNSSILKAKDGQEVPQDIGDHIVSLLEARAEAMGAQVPKPKPRAGGGPQQQQQRAGGRGAQQGPGQQFGGRGAGRADGFNAGQPAAMMGGGPATMRQMGMMAGGGGELGPGRTQESFPRNPRVINTCIW